MEKIPQKNSEPSVEGVGHLDDTGRKDLRNTLRTLALAGGVAWGLSQWDKDGSVDEESAEYQDPPVATAPIETTVEVSKQSEVVLPERREIIATPFTHIEVERAKRLHQLAWNEVQFVDSAGNPVGEPVVLKNFEAEYPEEKTIPVDKNGNQLANEYKYTYSKEINEIGLPMKGISPEWSEYKLREVQAKNESQFIVDKQHVTQDFEAAYENTDEPALAAGIAEGSIRTLEDIVTYYGSLPAYEGAQQNRLEYLKEHVSFPEYEPDHLRYMSDALKAEIARILPGIMAQESRGNTKLTSSRGARGPFQFMPDVWESHGGTDENAFDFVAQVDEVGERFANILGELRYHISDETLRSFRDRFPSQEAFELQLLAPAAVWAFNTGAKRVADAVEYYKEQGDMEAVDPQNLIIAIAELAYQSDEGTLASVGKDSRPYISNVYAWAETLAEEDVAEDEYKLAEGG